MRRRGYADLAPNVVADFLRYVAVQGLSVLPTALVVAVDCGVPVGKAVEVAYRRVGPGRIELEAEFSFDSHVRITGIAVDVDDRWHTLPCRPIYCWAGDTLHFSWAEGGDDGHR